MSEIEQDGLLTDLTAPQREAVLCTQGPLLILAAAGSGKTRVITRRIAHLLRSGVPPWGILALTFTNKAAAEMRKRVAKLLAEGITRQDGSPMFFSDRALRSLTISTFHSLCARLLRRYAEAAGLKPEFTIFDDGDQMSLVKRVIADAQLSTSNWPPRSVLAAISAAKNELMDADAYAMQATDFHSRSIAKIFKGYENGLRKAGAVDFDDLLGLLVKVLKTNPTVRDELRQRWQYLMIDEYQDTNHAQFEIARLLGGGTGILPVSPSGTGFQPVISNVSTSQERHGQDAHATANICVVGDPDQSIYGWRGADIANILEFEAQYPGCRVITLGENFRSTTRILEAADGLIKNNKRRKDKPLFTTRPGGEPLTVVMTRDEQHESRLVADWLRGIHMGDGGETDPVPWKDMAVFYRTNSLSRVMEDAMRAAGLPYVIARGTAFYDREEIKSAVSYLRVVANQADDISLRRVINVPTRGIGDTTIDKLDNAAQQTGGTLWDAAAEVSESMGLAARAVGAVKKFVALVQGWTGGGTFMGADVPSSLSQLVERVIVESGLRGMYTQQAAVSKNENDAARVDNLDELVSSARAFELEYDPAGDPAMGMPEEAGDAVPDFAADVAADEAGQQEGEEDQDQESTLGRAAPPEAESPEPAPIQGPGLLAMLRGFLESITLVADSDAIDPANGAVTLMTLHAAKGLEFGAVAMIGLEEGLLPHSRALQAEAEMEEERRLCFVGITRAMRHLHMSCAKYRTMRGLAERTIPSRFLEELPEHTRIMSDQADTFAGLEGTRWAGEGRGDDFGDRRPLASNSPSKPPAYAPRTELKPGPRVVPIDEVMNPDSRGQRQPGGGGDFPTGCLVRHPQFGTGKVISVTKGQNARAMIKFDNVGVKTLVLEYARLQRVR